MPLLKTESLEVAAYHPRLRHSTTLLHGVNLDIRENTITAIMGRSGSGKSILARAVSALLPVNVSISGGTIFYMGRPVQGEKHRKLLGSEIFYIAQDPMVLFNPRLKIKTQLWESAAVDKEWWFRVLMAMGFEQDQVNRVLNSYPWELSSGQLQRCLTAMAIGMKPRLMILDEPLSLLDQQRQYEIILLVESLMQEYSCTILLITHNRELADKLSHFQYHFEVSGSECDHPYRLLPKVATYKH